MRINCPRLVIAGLSGDSGKTITSLSLLTALKCRGQSISVFKKGPDYIDAAWLSWAAGTTCRNLDTYMVKADRVAESFSAACRNQDIAIIEGNRGLFDGKDAQGTHSTASLAKLLKSPVVLVVNCTKATRTIAAMIKGCQTFEPSLNLAGIILNRIAGKRHQQVITEAIEQSCGLPVLGAIPKLGDASTLIPGRHLGLVTPAEFGENSKLRSRLEQIANDYLDVDRLIEIATTAEPLPESKPKSSVGSDRFVRIGYFRDSVFTFYYPENLEALEKQGAELIPISSLDDALLPLIDGLYIGGGFPETHADKLALNKSLLDSVREAADNGLPIYAECGGLIILCRSLKCEGKTYRMAGVFDVDLQMHTRPVGHGYTEVTVEKANPFFEVGTTFRGHEFHYSGPIDKLAENYGCLQMKRGVGLGNRHDGLLYRNCLAGYTHLHADSLPEWATAVVSQAKEYREKRLKSNGNCCDRQEEPDILEIIKQSGKVMSALASG